MAGQPADAQKTLPVGVVIPTLNAMALLPEHVESMRPWLPLVNEIVVVDSHSADGSAAYLRAALAGYAVEIHQRPRGLYQAWNYGIAQIRSPYVYISTIGDSMTAAGLRHLVQVAEQLDVDVVLSPPAFVDEDGQRVAHLDWPVHRLIEQLDLRGPTRLGRLTAFGLALISIAQALLGSSASNLYRSACLRERPFPADYGTAGDCAWGLAHALRVDIAVTPGVFSTFREHQKAYAPSAYAVADLVLRLEALAEQAFAVATQADAALAAAPEASVIAALLRAREQIRVNQRALSAIRKSAGLPWFLRPRAWQARGRRNAGREAFDREARRLLRDLSHRPVDPGQLADLPYLEWARSG